MEGRRRGKDRSQFPRGLLTPDFKGRGSDTASAAAAKSAGNRVSAHSVWAVRSYTSVKMTSQMNKAFVNPFNSCVCAVDTIFYLFIEYLNLLFIHSM